jgi:hypothetical protein
MTLHGPPTASAPTGMPVRAPGFPGENLAPRARRSFGRPSALTRSTSAGKSRRSRAPSRRRGVVAGRRGGRAARAPPGLAATSRSAPPATRSCTARRARCYQPCSSGSPSRRRPPGLRRRLPARALHDASAATSPAPPARRAGGDLPVCAAGYPLVHCTTRPLLPALLLRLAGPAATFRSAPPATEQPGAGTLTGWRPPPPRSRTLLDATFTTTGAIGRRLRLRRRP